MSNPITGDFEAVLQVSGGTVNRLLATMHQNNSVNQSIPSFPHTLRMRIGDDRMVDGVRGHVRAQLGVPRIELIHGVSDRFIIELGVRAWYRADAGTNPLPAFIHGSVRAEYRIQPIDRTCAGWASDASSYLWVRVMKDSVRFAGTMAEDKSVLQQLGTMGGGVVDDAAMRARVEKQIGALLARKFRARPHPIAEGFRRDMMRSLSSPLTGSAVAIAVGLNGEPSGSIASVNNPFLEQADIGLGLDVQYLLSLAQPLLADIAKINLTIPVHVELPLKDFDTVYRVRVDPPTIAWEPHGWFGLFKVKVHGTATTQSIAADATFDVEQHLRVEFDAGRGTVVAAAAAPIVRTRASGLYHGTVNARTYAAVYKTVEAMAKAAVAQVQPRLDDIPARTAPLARQLATLDSKAALWFNEGLFERDGIILRGVIQLSPRHAPVAKQEMLAAKDGHTALDSWIPGGRIDQFEWSWTWSAASAAPAGKATHDDRFVLRRPRGRTSRWGAASGLETAIPGLDGWGSVCLRIRGVQVDAVTGALVPISSVRTCHRFGIPIAAGLGRLFLRDMPDLWTDVPFPQLSLRRAGEPGGEFTANTLIVLAGERWDDDAASALGEGLESCGRYDAGLAVLVLFQEGALARTPHMIAEVEDVFRRAGIAGLVNEDVHGGWSRALGVASGGADQAWRLVSPQGAVTWQHQGRLEARQLSNALDVHLHRSPDVSSAVRPRLEIGAAMSISELLSDLYDQAEALCPPPPPLTQGSVSTAVVTFVHAGASASHAHLRDLHAAYGQGGEQAPLVVAVVDSADARQVEALKNELGVDFLAVPDARGVIADRLGVDTWPTTVTVDDTGTVSAIYTGRRQPAAHAGGETDAGASPDA